MMRSIELLVLTGFIAIRLTNAPPVRAQSPAEFEVASIKPSTGSGNARTIRVDPGMVTIRSMSLKDLAARAYGPGHALQVSPRLLVAGGAKWCDDDLYDIDARPGGNPRGSGEEVSGMLSTLLAERFKLAFHHEQRETAGYVLVAGKDAAKMKARHPGDGGESLTGRSRRVPGGYEMIRRDTSMAALADFLGNLLERPVADNTGLAGTFDFELTWASDEAGVDSSLPGIFSALRDQMGLRLEAGKVTVDVMVIEHAEKPAAN